MSKIEGQLPVSWGNPVGWTTRKDDCRPSSDVLGVVGKAYVR